MKNKLSVAIVILLVLGLTSCNYEKEVEKVEEKNNIKVEQIKIKNNKVDVKKSVNDFDEKLIEEVVEPLLEIK